MIGSLARHGLAAILVAVVLEELSIPMPIPTDVLIVLAGTGAGGSIPRLGLLLVMLSATSMVGASGLYVIVRCGGRPLVERFGRWVHLGPKQLDRCEELLDRGGWGGIALGRAVPGLRYATVIACGLLKVPYPRFVTAHLVGSAVYITVFLVLGAAFGPAVVERIHQSASPVIDPLGMLLVLAVGVALLTVWLGLRAWRTRKKPVASVVGHGADGMVAAGATTLATAPSTIAAFAQHVYGTGGWSEGTASRGSAPGPLVAGRSGPGTPAGNALPIAGPGRPL